MVDLKRLSEVAQEIQSFVATNDVLIEFRRATDEFLENAKRLAAGDLTIGPLKHPSTADMPDRATADEIVRLVGLMPGPDGSEDAKLLYALGQVHGNVVEALMQAVFARYSEAVRAQQYEPH